MRNYIAECLKRVVTYPCILAEDRIKDDDRPSAVEGIDKFPASPAGEISVNALTPSDPRKPEMEEPEEKESTEGPEEGEDETFTRPQP